MFSQQLLVNAEKLIDLCRHKAWMIVSAESCTGGLISALFTEISGSSDVFERGFVTYSNEAKSELLNVPMTLINEWGAVSSQVALAMACGALNNSHADLAIAITGIAGPGGGSPEKPVGLVHIAIAQKEGPSQSQAVQFGDIGRSKVRQATLITALEMLYDAIEKN